jgi:hypothetical protein
MAATDQEKKCDPKQDVYSNQISEEMACQAQDQSNSVALVLSKKCSGSTITFDAEDFSPNSDRLMAMKNVDDADSPIKPVSDAKKHENGDDGNDNNSEAAGSDDSSTSTPPGEGVFMAFSQDREARPTLSSVSPYFSSGSQNQNNKENASNTKDAAAVASSKDNAPSKDPNHTIANTTSSEVDDASSPILRTPKRFKRLRISSDNGNNDTRNNNDGEGKNTIEMEMETTSCFPSDEVGRYPSSRQMIEDHAAALQRSKGSDVSHSMNDASSSAHQSNTEISNSTSTISISQKFQKQYELSDERKGKFIKQSVRLKSLMELSLRRMLEVSLNSRVSDDEDDDDDGRGEGKSGVSRANNSRDDSIDNMAAGDGNGEESSYDNKHEWTRAQHAMELAREHVAECMVLQRVRFHLC